MDQQRVYIFCVTPKIQAGKYLFLSVVSLNLHDLKNFVQIFSMTKKIMLKVSAILLVIFMLSFAACETAPICWECTNPHNPSERQVVCNSMSKAKLESYGHICTPY